MAALQTVIADQLFAWLLVFTRVGSAFMVLPVFGDLFVPAQVRLLLALVLSMLTTPALQPVLPHEPATVIQLALLLGGEIIIGIFIGTIPRLMVSALEVAGMVISMQTGLSNATVFNPSLAAQGSLPGSMLSWMALLLILITDVHHLMIAAIVHSYDIFKPGAPLPFEDFAHMITHVVGESFLIGVQMSAPFLATGLVFVFALGLMARLAPQMQVFMVFMSVQIAFGLFLFAVSIATMMMFWMRYFESGVMALVRTG